MLEYNQGNTNQSLENAIETSNDEIPPFIKKMKQGELTQDMVKQSSRPLNNWILILTIMSVTLLILLLMEDQEDYSLSDVHDDSTDDDITDDSTDDIEQISNGYHYSRNLTSERGPNWNKQIRKQKVIQNSKNQFSDSELGYREHIR